MLCVVRSCGLLGGPDPLPGALQQRADAVPFDGPWIPVRVGYGERLGLDVTGTDLNPNVIERAVTDRVLSMPATALDFPDETFDHVVTVHTIEHVPAIATAFREMSRVLRPGGTMLAVYPAEPIQGLFAIPTAVILHGNPFKAREVHCHRLTPGRVRALAEPVGLTETRHEFSFFATPQFTSVFAKV